MKALNFCAGCLQIVLFFALFSVSLPQAYAQAGQDVADEIAEVVDLQPDDATYKENLIEEIKKEAERLGDEFPNDPDAVKSGIKAYLKKIRNRSHSAKKPGGGEEGGSKNQGVTDWIKALHKALRGDALISVPNNVPDEIIEVVDLQPTHASYGETLIDEITQKVESLRNRFPNNEARVQEELKDFLNEIRDRSHTPNRPGGGGEGGNKHQGVDDWVKALLQELKAEELIRVPNNEDMDKLVVEATGTNQTTGPVARVTVYNPTGKPITVTFGPYFIPSRIFQSYLVVTRITLTIMPGETRYFILEGFCANIYAPPVPDGKPMADFEDWIVPDESLPLPESGSPIPGRGWEYAGQPETGSMIVTYPGTDIPLERTLDIHRYPETAAGMMLHAVEEITQTYEQMREEGRISTPISDYPEREKQAVIQQSFWIYTGTLTGDGYKMDKFVENGVKQFEEQSGQQAEQLPEAQQQELYQGLGTFWGTYEAVLKEAELMSEAEGPETAEPENK